MTKKAETELKDDVYAFLTNVVGGVWYKMSGSPYMERGIPDIIGCSPNGRFVGIELKTKVGKTSKLQDIQLNLIRNSNGIALVFYADEFTEEIKDKLTRLKGL